MQGIQKTFDPLEILIEMEDRLKGLSLTMKREKIRGWEAVEILSFAFEEVLNRLKEGS